jgi:hypothetical protein
VVEHPDAPREVADKGNAGLQRADEQGLQPLVVARDLGAELGDARRDLLGGEEDLPDPLVLLRQDAQDAFCSPNRAASRSKSRS